MLGARGVCLRRLAQLEEDVQKVCWLGAVHRRYQQAVVCCEDSLSGPASPHAEGASQMSRQSQSSRHLT